MIVKLGFVYVLEQRLAVTQEFKCFLTKKKYCSLLWSIIVENQFYKLIGNDLQLNTKLCYNELNITAIF